MCASNGCRYAHEKIRALAPLFRAIAPLFEAARWYNRHKNTHTQHPARFTPQQEARSSDKPTSTRIVSSFISKVLPWTISEKHGLDPNLPLCRYAHEKIRALAPLFEAARWYNRHKNTYTQHPARFTPQQEARSSDERTSTRIVSSFISKVLPWTISEKHGLDPNLPLCRCAQEKIRALASAFKAARFYNPQKNTHTQHPARFTPQQEARSSDKRNSIGIDSSFTSKVLLPWTISEEHSPDPHLPLYRKDCEQNLALAPEERFPFPAFRFHLPASSFLLAFLLLSGCSKKESTEPTAVPVQAAAAQVQSITEHTVTDAVLAPIAQAAISPKIAAPVRKFYVQRGAHVKAGQLLATLENSDLAAAVTDNQGSFDAADANFQTAVKAQVPEDYQNAQLAVAQAKANLDLAQSVLNSRKQLFAQGAIAGRDLDTSQAALVQAQAAYDTASKHLAGMNEVSHAAALKAAQGTFESAKGKYQGAEAQLSYSEIRSPIAGVVTDRPLYAGETPAPGTPFITVMDTSALLAKIHLSQPQAQLLKTGDPAQVSVPGLTDPVPGKIALVSPALDPGSTTVEVWVRLENPKGALRPGTAVHVSIAGRTAPKAVVVPSEAIIVPASGKTSVMVIGSDGVAHLTPVNAGIADAGMTQILSGIAAGQQVVTTGAASIDDGTKVKVTAPSDDDDQKSAPGQGAKGDDDK
jgi:multidrug efflux pump subunit AcrA (membrane-fusion protein)/rRNA maturation protein Nop10